MDVVTTTPTRIAVAAPVGTVSALLWPGPAEPDRTPAVLLHPVNTAATAWSLVAPHLDRPVLAVDYRGHGRSDPGPSYLPADFAADALAAIDHLGWTRYHLAGGSIGGAVAVEVAARAPERVASIACFGATLRIGLDEAVLEPLLDQLREVGIDGWFAEHGDENVGPRAQPGVVDFLVEVSRGRDLGVVEAVCRATFRHADARAAAERITPRPPALVRYGTHDLTCPQVMADDLAAHLGTTASALDGVGHLPMLEVPDEVVALLQSLYTATQED